MCVKFRKRGLVILGVGGAELHRIQAQANDTVGARFAEGMQFVLRPVYATLIGALQLARAVEGTALSDRILAAGADAVRALVQPRHNGG